MVRKKTKERYKLEDKIIIYSKEGCVQCRQTKLFLKSINVEYIEKDVEKDEVAMKEVLELGLKSLPVVLIPNKEPFSGFRPDLLEA